jgi:hypothetical protein
LIKRKKQFLIERLPYYLEEVEETDLKENDVINNLNDEQEKKIKEKEKQVIDSFVNEFLL